MSRKSIVAVDDSNLVLLTIEKILLEDYEVKSFSKEMRALKYLKSNVPDLIILDIEMPEMNGLEMLTHIKEREELKDVPVVFLTSDNSKQHIVEAVKGGAIDYMVKPINEKVLLEKVHSILGYVKANFSWDDV